MNGVEEKKTNKHCKLLSYIKLLKPLFSVLNTWKCEILHFTLIAHIIPQKEICWASTITVKELHLNGDNGVTSPPPPHVNKKFIYTRKMQIYTQFPPSVGLQNINSMNVEKKIKLSYCLKSKGWWFIQYWAHWKQSHLNVKPMHSMVIEKTKSSTEKRFYFSTVKSLTGKTAKPSWWFSCYVKLCANSAYRSKSHISLVRTTSLGVKW